MSNSLLIGNLPIEISEEELFEHFSPHGRVKSVSLVRTDRGQARGFAVVVMASRQEAIRASEALSNAEFSGRRLSVSLRKSAEKTGGFFSFLKKSD
ncbi:RNA-binding protein [bacterium]|nr:RNA-binding protein [bacterium]QQR59511.1 MAG: RNA-binding protein [Candidatus Melainabacteria bacterium]